MGSYESEKRGRKRALELLGVACWICGVSGKLEFHHKEYADGTKKWKLFKWSGAPTHREVLKHPERFQLLCRDCHRILHYYQKDPLRFELVYRYLLMIHSK